MELYVTNNNRNEQILKSISEFNTKHINYVAKIFYLNDIKERYYGEVVRHKKELKVVIDTIVKGTILNINNSNYKLKNIINILKNKEERINFFYYNNGITLICNDMSSIKTQNSILNRNACFTVTNPQIVNGCQTVNSIYEVLKDIDPSELENEFKDVFVMLKVLQIDNTNEKENQLYKEIVKYNNSQNSIDEKTFVSNTALFQRLQIEFEKKGFLLLIKQSNKNQFKNTYKQITTLKDNMK